MIASNPRSGSVTASSRCAARRRRAQGTVREWPTSKNAAMLDALAFTKAARAEGVPAALEISQSGQGAHVWVFFTEAVPAVAARGVGTALVREAILMRGSMNLSSYDRLFPNQDVLPDGGYGNLIAAPLNGQRRKDGLTLFLDLGTLEPHEDQWAYLSILDRLSVGAAIRIARQASRQVVGSQVSTLSRSAATKVHPPMPAVIRADLGAGLTLDTTDLRTPAPRSTSPRAPSCATNRRTPSEPCSPMTTASWSHHQARERPSWRAR
jgi:hypothetical protein